MPLDSSRARCRSCQASIAWLRTTTGKSIPVDWETISEEERRHLDCAGSTPVIFQPPRHVAHFATCPNADTHRRPR